MGCSLQDVRAHHRNRPVAKAWLMLAAGTLSVIDFPIQYTAWLEVNQSAREPERENVRSAFDYGKAVRSERG